MSHTQDYLDSFADYSVRFRIAEPNKRVERRRASSSRRRSTSPSAFNGIHRRRRKKSGF